jgi:AAA domain
MPLEPKDGTNLRPSAKLSNKPSATSASSSPSPDVPWSPASSMTDLQGFNGMIFSNPGVGKTTLGTTMAKAKDGSPLLVINFDEELRSIGDRSDIMVWPGEKQRGKVGSWLRACAFMDRLLRGNHPFGSIMLDTLNSAYDKFILPPIQEQMGERADGRQVYGKANDELLRYIRAFAAMSRERGTNILFVVHAEEKEEKTGDTTRIYIRPSVTPGVIKGMYQSISTIGYLEPGRLKSPRKLILHPTVKVVAKHHQPRTGPQIPSEISDPDLGLLIDHAKGVRPYPFKKETA